MREREGGEGGFFFWCKNVVSAKFGCISTTCMDAWKEA